MRELAEPSGGREAAESAAPSVHDSADDESELTDIDEEEEESKIEAEPEPAPMFPGLRKGSGPTAEVQEDGKSDGEQEDGHEEAKDAVMDGT